jgi:hypothetical protein
MEKTIKDKIIKDILNLTSGEKFTIGEYLKKYGVKDKKLCLELCFDIIKELENNIESVIKTDGENIPTIGLPQNIRYIKK